MSKMNKIGLSDLFGVAVITINEWIKRGCPYEVKGDKSKHWVFESRAVVDWYADQKVRNAVGDASQADEKELRRRKLAADTTVSEVAALTVIGDVVLVDDVASIISEDYAGLRARMRNIASRVSPLIVGETDEKIIKSEIETEVNNALSELSNKFIAGEDEFKDSDEPVEASAEATT